MASSTVTLTWADVGGETAYDLYREVRQKNGAYKGRSLIRTLGADATSTTDAPSAGTYRYQLVARNSAGSSASAYVTVTVPSTAKPGSRAARIA